MSTISSTSLTSWRKFQDRVKVAIGSVFREEEAVDVGPGSVTVRPYGEQGTQELRTLAGAVIRPGDRVVVLRLPALKLVLGTPTVRGVASVTPLPFGGYGGNYGVADEAARVDHSHTLVDKVLQPYAASSPSLSTGARLLTSAEVTLPDGVKCRIVARLRTTEKSDSGSAYFTLFLNIWNGTSSVTRTSEQIQCVAGVPNPATFEHTVVATGNGDAWPVSASVIYVSGGAIAVGAGELTVEVYPER